MHLFLIEAYFVCHIKLLGLLFHVSSAQKGGGGILASIKKDMHVSSIKMKAVLDYSN